MTVTQPVTTATDATTASRSALSIRNLHKTFRRKDGTTVPAINNTSLEVAQGEFLVLLGASGCGKSTFLRTIAGLEHPDSGTIESQGTLWFDSSDNMVLPPERRDLSMIFQSYALWPHMTVFDNVAYPLTTTRPKLPRAEIKDKVMTALKLVGIDDLATQYPSQVSGGQQQRLALARALVRGSQTVLFDEPLSNVDARVRDQLSAEIRSMQQRLGFTAIYVTHDQEEALAIADRIAVIDKGEVAHLGSPREIYHQPKNVRVARFVGKLNEIDGTVKVLRSDGSVTVHTALGDMVASSTENGLAEGDKCVMAWRPEKIRVNWSTPDQPNSYEAVIAKSQFLGAITNTTLTNGNSTFMLSESGDKPTTLGNTVSWTVLPEDVRALKPMA